MSGLRWFVLLAVVVAGACSCEVTAYKNNVQTGCECPAENPEVKP